MPKWNGTLVLMDPVSVVALCAAETCDICRVKGEKTKKKKERKKGKREIEQSNN